MSTLELLDEHRCFGGTMRFYQHESREIGLPMKFSVFLPPAAEKKAVPAMLWLAGLTCNEQTFMFKAGAQRKAAELGIALVAPDTSPRNANVPGEADDWDFGVGAGFYLDATQLGWSKHYRMESWLISELLPLLGTELPIDLQRVGMSGHSMGGHGALTLALRHPGLFRSLSAFAPICSPSKCPWGTKAFRGYLGPNEHGWLPYDATALMLSKRTAPFPDGILIDQGTSDKFLETQLMPGLFEAACLSIRQPLALRRREGYDHGYFFIASFIDEHLKFHAERLTPA
ncbi:S-formylglutathione hydrolase [Pelomonas sp. KK5]|uniref:S-formylglutathione hydrolase n=1 Tax=Pelomonas sp. KK5 TaxID=1855730 RepID=UPI00097C394E|nr:S-formylglutathione hydrolase [Pelomonas sp. KK5]